MFEYWNCWGNEMVATMKTGTVSSEAAFIRMVRKYFTPHYEPLVPWIIELREIVFPRGKTWKEQDEGLYTRMKELLQRAQEYLKGDMDQGQQTNLINSSIYPSQRLQSQLLLSQMAEVILHYCEVAINLGEMVL